ncbi:phage late control D family protein [Burkholderia ambifaria]|uniref:phage late control D family protein n=1 Tax=Burkholderia ambifaria TaxID=152480 RepID=UPI0021BC1FDF|nr:phage late control D family protein [Burkholderia ambifaria]
MSFALDERLGEPYRIDLTLTSPAPLARPDYLNRPAIFTIEPAAADGAADALRTFAGCITAFGQIRKTHDFVSYRIVVEPFVARLRLVETSRIYQQQSVPEIIESILRRHEFRSHPVCSCSGISGNACLRVADGPTLNGPFTRISPALPISTIPPSSLI